MAKIRVGDIEIDGSQITIGGTQITAPSASQVVVNTSAPAPATPATTNALATATPAPKPSRNDLAKLPGRPGLWLVAGLGLFTYSTVFAAVTIPYFVYLGLGISVMAILKQRAHREDEKKQEQLEHEEQLQLEAVLQPTLLALRRALSEASGPLTVEQLGQRVRVSQPELLRGLVCLRDQAELTEDLDVESGEWVYLLSRRQLASQNLDARVAALEETETDVPTRR